VYNGGAGFVDCLAAITLYKPPSWELIVVDDGSTDNSAATAAAVGANVQSTAGRMGPGYARNIGSQHASGDYLCFIDADCEVNEFTFRNLAEEIIENPDIEAFFGCYDDSPKATNFTAQYKNLCHRYVHQRSGDTVSTFWAGCGIVRRTTFIAVGGFDVNRFSRPSIEDIELGYRIKQMGGRIRVAKSVQVKHYKAWSLVNLIKVDVLDRGVPWTRLLAANPACRVDELNLQWTQRLCVVLSFLLVACIAGALVQPILLVGALSSALALCFLNRDIYRFFYENRGLSFMLKVVPMQWLYYFYAGVGFALGLAMHCFDRFFGRDPFLLEVRPPLRANLRELSRVRASDSV